VSSNIFLDLYNKTHMPREAYGGYRKMTGMLEPIKAANVARVGTGDAQTLSDGGLPLNVEPPINMASVFSQEGPTPPPGHPAAPPEAKAKEPQV
jgi:hypothetical protein